MKYWLLFIFSWVAVVATAQEEVQQKPISSGLGIRVDYGKLTTLASAFEQKIQVGVDFTLKKGLLLFANGGTATLTPQEAFNNLTYESSGTYLNAGMAYVFKLDGKSILYVGAGYGMGTYDEQGTYEIESTLFDNFIASYTRNNLSANWVTLNIGTEKQLGEGPFRIGTTIDVRILLDYESFEPLDSYTIPGYGRTFDNSVPAVNLYFKYQLSI